VGSLAIRAVHRRPDLELVGVWVHSEEKDGPDAGELAGLDPIGITASHNAEALLALAPECDGMVATAMRCVNAIPFVVDAPPGLVSSLDLPLTRPRSAFD
jgi:hypothetical protein